MTNNGCWQAAIAYIVEQFSCVRGRDKGVGVVDLVVVHQLVGVEIGRSVAGRK